MAFFDFIELKYEQLNTQINTYVRNMYSKSNEFFSSASPFGQILNVLKELYQFTILYQKNIVRNIDIETTSNIKVLRTYSRIAGHNPSRATSASGTLRITTKPNLDLTNNILNGSIKITDKTLLKNITNGLDYTIRLGSTEETFRLINNNFFYVNIIQGKYEEQTFTGTGYKNQSFSVNISSLAEIDNFDVQVLYNNSVLMIKDSLYDMLRYERACYTRTGMNGGLDIYFGNGHCGFIPDIGSIITVRYLLTNGNVGNILTPLLNDFKFITEVNDTAGNFINMNQLFDIVITESIQFASNGEGVLETRNALSNVSRNFVLSTAQQYIYHLTRLNLFSKINVYNTLSDNNYTNDNKVYLFLVPKVSDYFSQTVNYFNLPLSIYTLDQYEIDKTITYLQRLGNIPNGTELEVIQPRISKYVMFIYVIKKEGYTDETLKNNIITSVSEQLAYSTRDDRIVRSDLISTIESISGVDSINLTFISEKNELLHKQKASANVLGIDTIMGDIVVEKDELALIRGGWSDRNQTYYSENNGTSGLGPINIIFVGTTQK